MEQRIIDLSNYRISHAREDLETAVISFISNKYAQSLNRSYYAIFHAIRAILAFDKFDSKTHKGVINFFLLNYIKSKKFDVHFSNIINDAFDLRNDSDYEDFYYASKEDAEKQIENAKLFINEVESYLKSILNQ